MFDNDWATRYLINKGAFAVIGLTGILIWSIILKNEQDSRTFIRSEQVIATIVNIKKVERKSTDRYTSGVSFHTTYFVKLELPNQKHVKFMLDRKPPEVGAQVPINVDIYEDDKNYYSYNYIDWVTR